MTPKNYTVLMERVRILTSVKRKPPLKIFKVIKNNKETEIYIDGVWPDDGGEATISTINQLVDKTIDISCIVLTNVKGDTRHYLDKIERIYHDAAA
jgi:hypothetical protein